MFDSLVDLLDSGNEFQTLHLWVIPLYEMNAINTSVVDLGKVDLPVQEGFYQNRTGFIRSASRSQLDKHQIEVQSSIIRNEFGVGVFICSRAGLEKVVANGERESSRCVICHNFQCDWNVGHRR